MGKLLAVIAIGGLTLVGCSSNDEARLAEDQPDPPSSTSGSTTSTTTSGGVKTFTVGERVETPHGNEIIVYSYEQPSPPGEFLEPEPGFEYGVIDVEACAMSEPSDPSGVVATMDPSEYVLEMPDNTRLTASFGAAAEPSLEFTDVYQGDCVRGFVAYDVPVGQRPVVVRDTNATPPLRWTVP